jgi:hypothetical protein
MGFSILSSIHDAVTSFTTGAPTTPTENDFDLRGVQP